MSLEVLPVPTISRHNGKISYYLNQIKYRTWCQKKSNSNFRFNACENLTFNMGISIPRFIYIRNVFPYLPRRISLWLTVKPLYSTHIVYTIYVSFFISSFFNDAKQQPQFKTHCIIDRIMTIHLSWEWQGNNSVNELYRKKIIK